MWSRGGEASPGDTLIIVRSEEREREREREKEEERIILDHQQLQLTVRPRHTTGIVSKCHPTVRGIIIPVLSIFRLQISRVPKKFRLRTQ